MSSDSRDELWGAIYRVHYRAYYQEVLAERLVELWQGVDEVTKVLVAVTATGSAISGWALWSQPHFRYIWLAVAAVSSLLAIVHAALGVPARLKDWGEMRRLFAKIRIDAETAQELMRIDPNFPVDAFTARLTDLRRRYGEGVQVLKSDFLQTDRMRKTTQDKVDKLIGPASHGDAQ